MQPPALPLSRKFPYFKEIFAFEGNFKEMKKSKEILRKSPESKEILRKLLNSEQIQQTFSKLAAKSTFQTYNNILSDSG